MPTLGGVNIRPQQRLPEHNIGADTISSNAYYRVEFKHPAYPPGLDKFLTLPAFDHPNGGLHYNTAKIACGVFAGNRWDGFFTVDKDGEALDCDGEDILPPGPYYFHLPGYQDDRIETSYPLTPNFKQWKFPHGDLPPNWQHAPNTQQPLSQEMRSNASIAVYIRDTDQCRVTGRRVQCEVAHIVPVEVDDWFRANAMSQYVINPLRQSQAGISDINNMMLLRRDIHRSFDQDRMFVLVPKKPAQHQGNMVTHLIIPSDEYRFLYHNTLTYSLDSIPREYLLARFAWALLPRMEPFLLTEVPRLLITKSNGQFVASPKDCIDFTVSRGKRSGTGSPSKRQRSNTRAKDQDEQLSPGEEDDQAGEQCFKRATSMLAQPLLQSIEPASGPPCSNGSPTEVNNHAALDETMAEQEHFFKLTERALEVERQRSDPSGSWAEDRDWAMYILVNQFAKDISWDDVDEANRILGIVEKRPNWDEEECLVGSLS
ncbi:MAG: hypothetical protein Q9163_000192 [Psora crenata]